VCSSDLNVLVPVILTPGIMFTVLLLLPFLENWITGDKREHHLLQRPRNAPTRTAIMVSLMTFYAMAWLAGGNDIIAIKLHLSINQITYILRVAIFLGPLIAFIVTRRICIALQRHDNEVLLHGRESGVLMRTAQGEYYEKHEPLDPSTAYAWTVRDISADELATDPAVDGNGVENPKAIGKLRAKLRELYYADDVDKPTAEEYAEGQEHLAHGHGDDHHGEIPGGHGHH
jgi:ubiquinol-cytochrome c reductase cytochrome b subunit